jgi:hypothetical protein
VSEMSVVRIVNRRHQDRGTLPLPSLACLRLARTLVR